MQQAVLPAAALRALRPAVLRSLGLAARWFRDTMTDAATRRLFYAYDPTTKAHSRQRSPIRDLGTAANLALLQNQLPAGEVSADRHMFDEVIANTVSEYLSYLLHEHRPVSEVATAAGYHGGGAASTTPLRPPPAAGYAFLGSHHLHEPSSIAHSAMLILALCNWEAAEQRIPQLLLAAGSGDGGGSGSHHTSQHRVVEQLADGILSQQRQTDGTYAVYFPYFDRHHQRHHEDVGWELYAGEAMLALLSAYKLLRHGRYLASVETALPVYCRRAASRGAVPPNVFVFFANWQTQAARLLAQLTAHDRVQELACSYAFSLQDFIVDNENGLALFKRAAAYPGSTSNSTVEVACGLEGLADAYAMTFGSGGCSSSHQRRSLHTGTSGNEAVSSHGSEGDAAAAAAAAAAAGSQVAEQAPPPAAPSATAEAATGGGITIVDDDDTDKVDYGSAQHQQRFASGEGAETAASAVDGVQRRQKYEQAMLQAFSFLEVVQVKPPRPLRAQELAAARESPAAEAAAYTSAAKLAAQAEPPAAAGVSGGDSGAAAADLTRAARDDDPAIGGFGHALHMPGQRIDVTGHVVSAYLKLLQLLPAEAPAVTVP